MYADLFSQCRGSGMPHNFLNDRFLHTSFGQHGDTGVSGVVRCPLDTDLLHQGCPVAVKVVTVFERFFIFCMEKIFTFWAGVVPVPVEREQLVGNGYFPDAVFCFAVDHIKILLIQLHIYFFRDRNLEVRVPL